jgi:hypothetical protein
VRVLILAIRMMLPPYWISMCAMLLFLFLATRMILPPYWISMYAMHLFLFSALIFCTHYGHFGAHFERQYMHITTTTKMHIVYGNFSIFFFNEWMEKAS